MTSFRYNNVIVSTMIMMTIVCQSSVFAFFVPVTNKSNFSFSPTILSSAISSDNNNENSNTDVVGTTDNPFSMFDFERAMECAKDCNSAECSYEELYELRDAVQEQRLHDKVMTGIIGATPLMRERLEKESYLSDRLTKQMVDLNIEEFTTRTITPQKEEEKEIPTPQNSDNDTAAATATTTSTVMVATTTNENEKSNNDNTNISATAVASETDTTVIVPMNQNLLESIGIALFIVYLIFNGDNL